MAPMFFIFGVSPGQRSLGPGQTRPCPRCGNTTTWERLETHQRFSLFFIPILRWGRRRSEVCRICGETAPL